MAIYAYVRVSTDKQETDNQLPKILEQFPTAQVHEEIASGVKRRPVLEQLLSTLQKGDLLVTYSLDRLGRKTSEILRLIEDLERRGVILKTIREGVDYSTIAGRLVTQILCSVAEMERALISERTRVALAAKRSQGIVGGRRKSFPEDKLARIRDMRAKGIPLKEIAEAEGLSVSRISQLVGEHRKISAQVKAS